MVTFVWPLQGLHGVAFASTRRKARIISCCPWLFCCNRVCSTIWFACSSSCRGHTMQASYSCQHWECQCDIIKHPAVSISNPIPPYKYERCAFNTLTLAVKLKQSLHYSGSLHREMKSLTIRCLTNFKTLPKGCACKVCTCMKSQIDTVDRVSARQFTHGVIAHLASFSSVLDTYIKQHS